MGFNGWRSNRIFQPCVQGMMSIPGGVVNFTSHLDLAKGRPDSWVCLWQCLQKRLAFELVDRAQQVALFSVGGHHPIHQGPEWNKKVEEGWICSPPGWLELGCWSCPALSTCCSQDLRPRLESTTSASQLLGLPTASAIFLGLQCAESRLWNFSASIVAWVSLYLNRSVCLSFCLSPSLSVSLSLCLSLSIYMYACFASLENPG